MLERLKALKAELEMELVRAREQEAVVSSPSCTNILIWNVADIHNR